ncbi:MAG: DegV family protein [Asgard group archaeon]|nr:DegV family protein [Asgard group archaeon]
MHLKIKVITDTSADLPLDVIRDNKIEIISQIVSFEDKALRLGKDISFDEYYEILERLEKIPTTAAPDPASFYKVFENFIQKQKYDFVFCVTVSKELSGTYASAAIAARKIGDKVVLVNSDSASGVEGLIALNIVELANKGCSINEIKDTITHMKKDSLLCAGFHTFDNIYKSGRLKSKFILKTTNFLRIKPILVLEEKKVLQPKFPGLFSENQMLNRMLKASLKRVNKNLIFDMVISHVANPRGASKLRDKIKNRLKIRNEYFTIATPLVGTHTGKKTVILSLVPVFEPIKSNYDDD